MPSFRRNPTTIFKLLAAFIVVTFYLILRGFSGFGPRIRNEPQQIGASIQFEGWKNGSGVADEQRAGRVRVAMKYTFWKYREYAWGFDDIMPVSGNGGTNRNGWGAFIVDSTTTLALMGLWDELELAVDHIIHSINFNTAISDLVDPFETTIQYLGALISLVDLIDADMVPESVINNTKRDAILAQAVTLANKLAPSFDSPTGMMWPRVNFYTDTGALSPNPLSGPEASTHRYSGHTIDPARAGSNILENRVLSRLTNNDIYFANATRAWAPLVWSPYITPWKGMVDGPINILTGEPLGRERHWDAGHGSYYEHLLKISLLAPHDRYTRHYQKTWLSAAAALRHNISQRSAPTDLHRPQHLFMGKQDGQWFLNEQSHLACFAPGNLMLGGRFLDHPNLVSLGKALLEGCHHTYASSATHLGPEIWSWLPQSAPYLSNATFTPTTVRHTLELAENGFWIVNPTFRLRPEYAESLFYAYRITGEQRYRDWAWDVFVALEKHCKTRFGFAGLKDVMGGGDDGWWIDEGLESWVTQSLMYLWLVFEEVDVGSLDRWVYSTEGHLFRMIR
ncbi:glycoside hydrolase family 47 protein [Lepidopterella palustris CBS 459.81]|uniref:alpha-1,2-Mannosidase n=1 Tax=Lepidopterella palustris CBS 459.81 TaxID=1314670 RepID=A0A8E2JKR4_9PEZI|nr:glycoside hydrolase family 47 protein [Lepidopterella palustris CBS 459.81]